MGALPVPACPQCGEPVERGDRFCEACGTNVRTERRSSATAAPPGGGACPGCGEPAPDEYCQGCGLRRPDGTEHLQLDLARLAGISDRGRVHARNEDAFAIGRFTGSDRVAAVVCDGVSTAHRPELASRAAADTALDVLLADGPDAGSGPELMRKAVAAAAGAVARLSRTRVRDAPACTLVAALADGIDTDHPEITVGWLGDSRAYWLAAPQAAEPARLLTTDHSWAAEQTAAGALDAATAAKHPLAHAITRWLGADTMAEPDIRTVRPTAPGALLLCTDGLWNYRPEAADLAALALPALTRGPLAAATALATVALESGGRDNVTVVVAGVDGRTERSSS